MTAKKTTDTTDTTTPDTAATDQPAGVVTSRNDNASDPTGVNPAATPETSTTPTLAVDPVGDVAEVRYPISCLAPMPCTCPKCVGVGTDENTLNAEEAADAAEAVLPAVQTDEEAAAGAEAADKTAADNKAAEKAAEDDKPAK